jgi:hypothetical protein
MPSLHLSDNTEAINWVTREHSLQTHTVQKLLFREQFLHIFTQRCCLGCQHPVRDHYILFSNPHESIPVAASVPLEYVFITSSIMETNSFSNGCRKTNRLLGLDDNGAFSSWRCGSLHAVCQAVFLELLKRCTQLERQR